MFFFCRLEQQQIKDSLRKDTVVRTEKLRDEQSASSFGFGSKMNRSHSTPDLAQVCSSFFPLLVFLGQ